MKKFRSAYHVSLGVVHTHTHTHTHGYLLSEQWSKGGSREQLKVSTLPRDFE